MVAIATRRDNSNILLGGVWGARGQEVGWTQIAFLQQNFCCLVNILLESPSQLRGVALDPVPELPMLARAPRCSIWMYPLDQKNECRNKTHVIGLLSAAPDLAKG